MGSESALGAAVLDLTGDTDSLGASMNDAKRIVEDHLGIMKGIVDEKMLLIVGGIAAIAGGAIGAAKIGVDALLSWSGQVKSLNELLGISGEQASVFATAMNTVGLSTEEGAGGINIFIRNLDASRTASQQALAQYKSAAQDMLEQHNETLGLMLADWMQVQTDAAERTIEIQESLADSVEKVNEDLGRRLSQMERERNKEIKNFAKEQAQIERDAARESQSINRERNKSLANLTKDTNKRLKSAKTAEQRAEILEEAAERKKEIIAQARERLAQVEERRRERAQELADKKKESQEEYAYRVQLEKDAAQRQIDAAEKAAQKQVEAVEKMLEKQEKAYERNQQKENDRYAREAEKLSKALAKAEESNPMAKALKRLGINALDAQGNIRPINELLPQIMDAFKKFPAGPEASAIAMQLFGRSGTKFMEFLRLGSEGLKAAQKDAEAFGLIVSTEDAQAAEDFGFALNTLGLAAQGFWMTIGREVFPILSQLINNGTQWARENMPGIQAGIKQFLDWLLPKLQMVGDAIKTGDWSKLVDQFLGWLNGENGVIKRLPGLLDGLTTQIKSWADVPENQTKMKEIGKTVGTALVDGIKGIFENKELIGDVLKALLTTGWTFLSESPKLFGDLGGSFVRGLIDAIIKAITGEEMKKELGDAIENAVSGGLGVAAAALNPASLLSFLTSGGLKFPALPGRALGGPVAAYQPVVVGERRPEIFMPSVSGRIYPDAGGGARTTYAYVNVYGDDEARLDRAMRRILYRERGR